MTRALSVPLTDKAITLANALATLPWPTLAGDGASIEDWRSGPYAPRFSLIEFYNADDVAVQIDTPELAGHITGGAAAAWASLGLLGGGASLIIQPGSRAYLPAPQDMACGLFDRWYVAASAVTGTTPQVTVRAIPLEVQG